jgi:hypothetical protein
VLGFCGVLRTQRPNSWVAQLGSAASRDSIEVTLPRGVGAAGSVHQSLARTRLAKRALSKGGDAALSVVASEPQLIHH